MPERLPIYKQFYLQQLCVVKRMSKKQKRKKEKWIFYIPLLVLTGHAYASAPALEKDLARERGGCFLLAAEPDQASPGRAVFGTLTHEVKTPDESRWLPFAVRTAGAFVEKDDLCEWGALALSVEIEILPEGWGELVFEKGCLFSGPDVSEGNPLSREAVSRRLAQNRIAAEPLSVEGPDDGNPNKEKPQSPLWAAMCYRVTPLDGPDGDCPLGGARFESWRSRVSSPDEEDPVEGIVSRVRCLSTEEVSFRRHLYRLKSGSGGEARR